MSVATDLARRWGPAVFVLLGLALLAALAWWVIQQMLSGAAVRPHRSLQEISLVRPPPPPPPPPKAEPPKVEPQPKMEVPHKVETPQPDKQPEPPPEAPPPGPALGLDAAGGAGSDAFGLAARKGGSDLIGGTGSGGGGAGPGNRFAWYGALVKERIQEAVARDRTLGHADYRISVNVWIDIRGAVTRAELVDSTGDPALDDALRAALRQLEPLREGAPGDMPQPIRLRITARG